jgi:hypothetical protein
MIYTVNGIEEQLLLENLLNNTILDISQTSASALRHRPTSFRKAVHMKQPRHYESAETCLSDIHPRVILKLLQY